MTDTRSPLCASTRSTKAHLFSLRYLGVVAVLTLAFYNAPAAHADTLSNARGLPMPEALTLCRPLNWLGHERVRLGTSRNGPDRNTFLHEKTDAIKSICF